MKRLFCSVISAFILLTGSAFASDVQVVTNEAAKIELDHAAHSAKGIKETAESLLVTLIDKATQVGDFVLGQVPIVIKELLIFNTARYALFLALGAAGILLTFLVVVPWAIEQAHYSDGISYVPVIALLAGSGVLTLLNLIDLLEITLAPRVWLIEYAASLVK